MQWAGFELLDLFVYSFLQEFIQIQTGDSFIQFPLYSSFELSYEHFTRGRDPALIQVAADHTHILAAEIDMQMQIGFALFGRNIAEERSNLHRTIEAVLVVLPCCDIIEADNHMIRSAERFYRSELDLLFLAELRQRRNYFFSAIHTNNIGVINHVHLLQRIARQKIRLCVFQTIFAAGCFY